MPIKAFLLILCRDAFAAATGQAVGTTADAALIDCVFSLRSLREMSSVGSSVANGVALQQCLRTIRNSVYDS